MRSIPYIITITAGMSSSAMAQTHFTTPCPSDVRQALQAQVERAMRYLNTGDKYYVEQAQQILESVARQQRNFNCTKADVLRGLPSWLSPPR
jgi:Tfp pilus assembly protein PilF